MKSFQGKSYNITTPIMGIVAKKRSRTWFKKITQIGCVYNNSNKFPKADAYIVAGEYLFKNIQTPSIQNLSSKELDELNEGDVLYLSKEGKVNVVYSIKSGHNVIFATNRCNEHCIMCPQPSHPDAEDMLRRNILLIKMMNQKQTIHLAITGGEPTLLGEGLLELILTCKKYLPRTALAILTNGKRFSDLEFARDIASLKHPNIMFAVPIYSDNSDIHDLIVGVPGSFYETIKGLHNLALFRQRVEIRTVIHALNSNRVLQLSEFLFHNFPFVAHIALMAVEMTGAARANADKLWIDPYDYSSQLEDAVRYFHRADMNVSIYNHQLCILPTSLWTFSRKSISDWKNNYLDACEGCVQQSNCGGFFTTGGEYFSKHIHRLL